MIPRTLANKITQLSRKFPVIALTGPRQSGKTTLTRSLFARKPYVSMEDPDTREQAQTDPRGFLASYPKGAIFDEIQRTPHLFSYIQGIVDDKQTPGRYILTGSQNFLLMQNLSQTMAGRVSILRLLPLSIEELEGHGLCPKSADEAIFKGFYPRLYDKRISPVDWYPVYIQSYLERDVRLIKNVDNLGLFQKFLKLCAARTGQILNLSSLANDCGITHNTAGSWIRLLEAGMIAYLLKPYHKNFNKRIIKAPKLYFYDTGLACALMGIQNRLQVSTHPLRGALFETMMMSELVKAGCHRGLPENLYYWRDKIGNEIDCIIEKGPQLLPIEVKSGQTLSSDAFRGLSYWNKVTKASNESVIIFAGSIHQQWKMTRAIPWRSKDVSRLL